MANNQSINSDHALNKLVNLLISVTPISLAELGETVSLANITALGRLELESPEEIRHLFEVGSSGVDLVDHILDAVNSVLTELLRDYLVVLDSDTLTRSGLANTEEATLVDKLAD